MLGSTMQDPGVEMKEHVMGVRGVTIAMMSLTLAGLATGCVTHPYRASRDTVANTADRLEQDSDLLARDAAAPTARSEYTTGFARDTHQLAIDTHELRRTVEERDSSDADVQTAFDKVSRSFHAVRDEVNHADLEGVQRDFHPLANDYRDLRSELGESPDREARADYPPPPVER